MRVQSLFHQWFAARHVVNHLSLLIQKHVLNCLRLLVIDKLVTLIDNFFNGILTSK